MLKIAANDRNFRWYQRVKEFANVCRMMRQQIRLTGFANRGSGGKHRCCVCGVLAWLPSRLGKASFRGLRHHSHNLFGFIGLDCLPQALTHACRIATQIHCSSCAFTTQTEALDKVNTGLSPNQTPSGHRQANSAAARRLHHAFLALRYQTDAYHRRDPSRCRGACHALKLARQSRSSRHENRETHAPRPVYSTAQRYSRRTA